MKERVNHLRAAEDRSSVPSSEQLACEYSETTQPQMVPRLPATLEGELRLDAAARKYLEGSAEAMVVDRRGSIDPKQHIDVEGAPTKQSDRRLTESSDGIGLSRQ